MSVQINCSFCGRIIDHFVTTGISEATETVDIKERTCNFCDEKKIKDSFLAEFLEIKLLWETKEREIKNFNKQNLRIQKRDFFIEKAKKYFGTFYTPEVEEELKGMINA